MTGLRRIVALILLAAVFVMEGFDINAMALAVPRLAGPLGLEPPNFGLVLSALPLALGAGGAVLAPFGDRFGRRTLIVAGCLGVALFTLATATSGSIPEFLLWRLLTGIALGACLPNCSALSAELAPEGLRATVMAVVSAGIPLGLSAAGLFAPEIIGLIGWQGLFLTPGVVAAALALLHFAVLTSGRPAARSEAATTAKLPQLALLRSPWLLPFAVFVALLSLNSLNLYLLTQWLPTVLPEAGFTKDQAARISGVVQLSGLAIGVIVSLLIDRWRPAISLAGTFLSIAACFAAIGMTAPDPTRWIALLMIGVGGASAGAMALPALCVHLFPQRLLSSAIGTGVLIGRIGAAAGPLLGTLMLQAHVAPRLFLAMAALPAVLCALVCVALPTALRVREGAA